MRPQSFRYYFITYGKKELIFYILILQEWKIVYFSICITFLTSGNKKKYFGPFYKQRKHIIILISGIHFILFYLLNSLFTFDEKIILFSSIYKVSILCSFIFTFHIIFSLLVRKLLLSSHFYLYVDFLWEINNLFFVFFSTSCDKKSSNFFYKVFGTFKRNVFGILSLLTRKQKKIIFLKSFFIDKVSRNFSLKILLEFLYLILFLRHITSK